jgi:hypothetical protein
MYIKMNIYTLIYHINAKIQLKQNINSINYMYIQKKCIPLR